MRGEIQQKWGMFNAQEIAALKDKDDLVTQVQAKYALDKTKAQRDVTESRRPTATPLSSSARNPSTWTTPANTPTLGPPSSARCSARRFRMPALGATGGRGLAVILLNQAQR
jgi:hypothetical protein